MSIGIILVCSKRAMTIVSTQSESVGKNANMEAAAGISVVTDSDLRNWVSKESERKLGTNGLTIESNSLNHNKLFSAVAAVWKSHLGRAKDSRLEAEYADRLTKVISEFVAQKLEVIASNAIGFRRYFKHQSRNRRVVHGLQATGEELISLKQQAFGIKLLINAREQRLKDVMAKPTPNLDLEKSIKEQIQDMEMTKAFIDAQISKMAELKS